MNDDDYALCMIAVNNEYMHIMIVMICMMVINNEHAYICMHEGSYA